MAAEQGIRAFWTWWHEARHDIAHAISHGGCSPKHVESISAHVNAIDGDLDWELSPGQHAKHAFALSARGDLDKRMITETWRQLGPQPDETWEYYAARPGLKGLPIVKYEGVPLDPAKIAVAFTVDSSRERVDGSYFHPNLSRVNEKRRAAAMYVLLDGAFGEDGVERWLGAIEVVEREPPNAVPFATFREAMTDLARTATGEQFAFGELTTDDGDVLLTFNRALKRIDHLMCTVHAAIEITFFEHRDNGWPTDGELEVVKDFGEELAGELRGIGVYFGRETRQDRRTLHYYVAEDSAAQGIVTRWAARYGDRVTGVELSRDPGWSFVKRYV